MASLLDSPEIRDVPDTGASESPDIPVLFAQPLSALVRPPPNDATELLRHRYLCQGGGLLLCGPTGIGKSALALQAMILWAIGREMFGIVPARPLRSLLIQAENDAGDLAEMRDGIIAGLHLAEAEVETACADVLICREDELLGAAFFGGIKQLLMALKPDVLWIDPVLAYLGGEANSQRDVGGFLRNGLNPLLREFNCAAVVIHHTNKPANGREKPTWQAGDFAYLGAGSAEFANWPRAILALRSVGSHEIFELQAGKRGARLGWKGADGSKTYVKYVAHAKEPDGICWREVLPDEIEAGGAPKKYDATQVLALLPPEGLATSDWKKLAKEEYGISERSFFRERAALEKASRIHRSKVTEKWQPVKSK
jgi:hypothetical protein